ncbi:VOC family protein [Streptosporangium sp. DT93]|uniref:VOC family protein n=1 Tax=Streptosporangium sp. DT93 TaxID=3393428 RepID=UPI003CF2A794
MVPPARPVPAPVGPARHPLRRRLLSDGGLVTTRRSSSGARATSPGTPAGRNRVHLVVEDLDDEIGRLRDAGLPFQGDVVAGPGGRQILLTDPAGNLVEPAHRAITG